MATTFLLILTIPAVLLFIMIVGSLFSGSDQSGVAAAIKKKSREEAPEYYSEDEDIEQLRGMLGPARTDRHTAMPTQGFGGQDAMDEVELEELVEMTNADRRRENLPPLTREEIIARYAG